MPTQQDHAAKGDDLEEPLLRNGVATNAAVAAEPSGHLSVTESLLSSATILIEDEEPPQDHQCITVTQATANLATTIIGAGIMALPRTYATLGILPGTAALALVYGLSYFTLAGLIRVSELAEQWTYADVVATHFGRRGSASYRGAILINNAGTMIVYLIILGDLLVGVPPHYNGLVTDLVGIHDPGVWYVSRPFVLGTLCCAALGPLLSLRSLASLARMSAAAVAVAAGFVVAVVGLAATAAVQGKLGDYHWVSSMAQMGGSPGAAAVSLLAVLPVITMSFVCHYNILPLASGLQRFTERRIRMVIRRALSACTAAFTLVAAGGYALFGSDTQDNILNNLTPARLESLVGRPGSDALCLAIRLGYCLCLTATFCMLNWALRETVCKLAFGSETLSGPAFYPVSWALLAFLYCVAVSVPSIWTAMSLTGSTAAVYIAFILPGLLLLRAEERPWPRVLAAACVVLGLCMGVVGVLNTLVLSRH